MSRVAAMRAATAVSSTLATSGRRSTSGCAPLNGRSSSAQPSGVSQRRTPRPSTVSARIRSRKRTATTTKPSSSATRRVGASWLASAPIEAHTTATLAVARAR